LSTAERQLYGWARSATKCLATGPDTAADAFQFFYASACQGATSGTSVQRQRPVQMSKGEVR